MKKINTNKRLATSAMVFAAIGLGWLTVLYFLIQASRVMAPQAQMLSALFFFLAWPLSVVQWMIGDANTTYEFMMVIFGMQATLAWWWLSAVFIESRLLPHAKSR